MVIESWIILGSVTFIAAVLQIVTGFGFGLLCVPVFLWMLDSIAAIHLVTLITLVMSLAILPSARTKMVPKLLFTLSAGVLIGSPEQMVDQVGRYTEVGVDQINLAMRAPWDLSVLDHVAEVMTASAT
jgi:hypothetical protein